MKIGFFDSGIGGLCVLHSAAKVIPCGDYIYYADEDNVPYGEKTRGEILAVSDKAVSFLLEKGARIIVIACNTATSAAVSVLRERYSVPFVGMEPAVKPAVSRANGKRVLVTATPFTIREEKLQKLLDAYDKDKIVDVLALPELVGYAERLEFVSGKIEAYLKERFSSFDMSRYGSIVLGCTHFNYFKDSFRAVLPKDISLVDGIRGAVNQLISLMRETDDPEIACGRTEYYISGRPVTDTGVLEKFKTLHKRLDCMELI